MSLLTGTLNQDAVYWGSPENDGFGGFIWADSEGPQLVEVRWEDRQEIFMDALGEQHLSRAVAYVSRDMDIGGYLFLGNLTEMEAISGIDVGTGDDDSDVIGAGDDILDGPIDVVDAGVEDPRDVEGAMRIRAFLKIPELNISTEYVRKVFLQ